MAPKTAPLPPYAKDEKVLCFHHDMLYEAKVLDIKAGEAAPTDPWQVRIHYKGWKTSWDEWVPEDRVRKLNDENRELAATLMQQARSTQQKATKAGVAVVTKKGPAGKGASADHGSARASEDGGSAGVGATGRGPRRLKDYETENEEAFHSRPTVKITMPDLLKGFLVDDWEHVTKNHLLVPLPHEHPVDEILKDYMAFEGARRSEGSPSMSILEETIAGIRSYFEKALGRILLYRFERLQYVEFRDAWDAQPSESREGPCSVYGAEHLSRLLVTIPELVGQTNMDQQSVNRLCDELIKLNHWLSRNAAKYFVSDYVAPTNDYVVRAGAN